MVGKVVGVTVVVVVVNVVVGTGVTGVVKCSNNRRSRRLPEGMQISACCACARASGLGTVHAPKSTFLDARDCACTCI